MSFLNSLAEICRDLERPHGPTAVLVRTPPPAAAFTNAITGGNPDYLQCNTFFEGFAVGMLYGAYPRVPTWYCHPNAIRTLFSGPSEGYKVWRSREEEAADVMAMAMSVVGTRLRHEREAGCILAAVYHYIKFAQGGFGDSRSAQESCVGVPSTTALLPTPVFAQQELPPPPPPPSPNPATVPEKPCKWSRMPSAVKASPTDTQVAALDVKTIPISYKKRRTSADLQKQQQAKPRYVITEPDL